MSKKIRKTMKKCVAGMLAMLLVSTCNIIPAKAAVSGSLVYEIISEQAYITDCDVTTIGDLEIPETIEGYPVVAIVGYAFGGCTELTSITIPEGVTSIGSYAFGECSSLTSINIPTSVTSIGTYAFLNCKNLTSIELPAGITSVGKGMFKGCKGLVSMTVPTGVTSIGASAFEGCSSLNSISIPTSVASIGDKAFYNCSSLISVDIPAGITSIGASVFYGCSSMTRVGIPTSVTSIGASAFYSCSSLSDVSIPVGVTSIGNAAFNECSSLTEVTIPEGVTSIGASTFNGCSNLTNLTISEGVTSIGNYAFYGCSSLTELSIPEGVTSVGSNAFAYCEGLTDVSLPSTVTSIDEYAFAYCVSLKNINVPEGITSVGNYAFSECGNLTSIVLPESLTTLGAGAFSACRNLASVNIPSKITSIEAETFYKCVSLETIDIPEGVTSIGASAFARCENLKTIDIPEGVATIDNGAFQSCSNLTKVAVPQSVTSLGEEVFAESGQVVIYTPSEYVKNYAESHRVKYIWITDKIEIKQLPNKLNYALNEEFSSEGLILLAYHGEVTEEIVSGYEVSGFDSSQPGNCTVVVTYNDQTTSFDVSIRELKLTKATLKLENDISVLFRTPVETIDGAYTNCYVVVKQYLEDGETKSQTINGVLTEDGSSYEFKYTGVNAREIGDGMDVTIYAYVGDELVTGNTISDYSVIKYCTGSLAKSASELGFSEEKTAAFKTLMVDLVNYGAEAQKYFEYKTDSLVTEQLTEEQKAYASADSVLDSLTNVTTTKYETIENPTASWKAATLLLKAKAEIRLKFAYSGDISNVKMVARVSGGDTYEVTEFEQIDSNLYYVRFDNIRASQFSDAIDFQIVDGDTIVSNTLRYSVESYASGNTTSETIGNVVSALMKYGKAANSFNVVE